MIELDPKPKKLSPKDRPVRISICGACGEIFRDCECAEKQEKRKAEELERLKSDPPR